MSLSFEWLHTPEECNGKPSSDWINVMTVCMLLYNLNSDKNNDNCDFLTFLTSTYLKACRVVLYLFVHILLLLNGNGSFIESKGNKPWLLRRAGNVYAGAGGWRLMKEVCFLNRMYLRSLTRSLEDFPKSSAACRRRSSFCTYTRTRTHTHTPNTQAAKFHRLSTAATACQSKTKTRLCSFNCIKCFQRNRLTSRQN